MHVHARTAAVHTYIVHVCVHTPIKPTSVEGRGRGEGTAQLFPMPGEKCYIDFFYFIFFSILFSWLVLLLFVFIFSMFYKSLSANLASPCEAEISSAFIQCGHFPGIHVDTSAGRLDIETKDRNRFPKPKRRIRKVFYYRPSQSGADHKPQHIFGKKRSGNACFGLWCLISELLFCFVPHLPSPPPWAGILVLFLYLSTYLVIFKAFRSDRLAVLVNDCKGGRELGWSPSGHAALERAWGSRGADTTSCLWGAEEGPLSPLAWDVEEGEMPKEKGTCLNPAPPPLK